ncbi:MAG TPA: hypothetical protein VMU03_11610 [Gammaproteobacteria bacterium]|nr:hypothetical protein [Gammaproteobacteria bacterium]
MQVARTRIATAVGLALAAVCFTSAAYAGCSPLQSAPAPGGQQAAPSQPAPEAPRVNGFKGVQFIQASDKATFLHTNFDSWVDDAPIVGLWKVQFIVDDGSPNGLVIDDGYATWHSDGTELMNSSRPPMTGNFCMGVWKRTGPSTFSLNHFALSWDPTGTQFIGPANIRETVTVDRRANNYTGSFTITQYAPDGKSQLGGVSGKVVGKRINP